MDQDREPVAYDPAMDLVVKWMWSSREPVAYDPAMDLVVKWMWSRFGSSRPGRQMDLGEIWAK